MLTRMHRTAPAAILVALLIGCNENPVTDTSAGTMLDATLDQLAAESNGRGDAEGAAAFSGGALAIRLGVRPTEISVSVAGEVSRYQAIVTGIKETNGAGVSTVHRSLVAWKGQDRPIALLQVNSTADAATFGSSVARANGVWADLTQRSRWIAADGTVGMVLNSTGESCDGPAARPLGVSCVVARYGVSIDGIFRQAATRTAPSGEGVRIMVSESGVAGVLLSRTVTPTRTTRTTTGR